MNEVIGEITSLIIKANSKTVSVTLKWPIKIRKGRKVRFPLYIQETIQNVLDIPEVKSTAVQKEMR